MRIILFIIGVFLSFHSTFSQNTLSEKYALREQITLKDCDGVIDKNKCLSDLFGNALADITNNELRKLRIQDDTLRISIGFSLNDRGRFDKYPIQISISNKILSNESYDVYENFLNKLPRFDIAHRRPEGYRSLHEFDFIYKVNKEVTPQKVLSFDLEKDYSGGKIVMVPIFPGCENLLYQETINCFTTNMKQHISTNFKYPEEAYRNNIQGKVYILFVINEKGEIENIRTKGAADILQIEAIRIIELLPQFEPALVDGIPTRIPFSIPIAFKLNKF
ncbi:MAG: energy transducer TonB [Eudoraea sp.]|nr:energy transducer TonB [Eudoraea sp.]